MKCDLCPAPAIVECLCLACADLLWMAELWRYWPKRAALLALTVAQGVDPHTTTEFGSEPLCAAKMAAMPTAAHASAFLDKRLAAIAARRRREA
jgi:hypothetical protein